MAGLFYIPEYKESRVILLRNCTHTWHFHPIILSHVLVLIILWFMIGVDCNQSTVLYPSGEILSIRSMHNHQMMILFLWRYMSTILLISNTLCKSWANTTNSIQCYVIEWEIERRDVLVRPNWKTIVTMTLTHKETSSILLTPIILCNPNLHQEQD